MNRAWCKTVAELAVYNGALTAEQGNDYASRFAALKSVNTFVALFNEMMKATNGYNRKVTTDTDNVADRQNLSRRMEKNGESESCYTYGLWNRLTVSKKGVPYTDVGSAGLTETQIHLISRLLEAAYPLDM